MKTPDLLKTTKVSHARREPQWGPGKHSREALSQFLYMLRVRRREGGNVGGVFPHHLTRDLGERRKLFQWVPGLKKMDFMHT